MIITNATDVRGIYQYTSLRGWVLPCICSENLTTTEAILQSALEFGIENKIPDIPIILAITCNYDHRSQAKNYTRTGDWRTGLNLFTNDIYELAGKGGPFEKLNVMIHLDHIQFDTDAELLDSDLSRYSSIMFDASVLPFQENIKRTAQFVDKNRNKIVIEGACDEIVDATGSVHNELTTPDNALEYLEQTGADLIVANLGTEHRATGKVLQYHSEVARSIKNKIGNRIVLHGTSSVSNEQVKDLFLDGVCKVNIWTALERDSSPVLLEEMIKNASKVGGDAMVRKLISEGYLTEKCKTNDKISIDSFTHLYRESIVFEEMKKMVRAYLDLWYR